MASSRPSTTSSLDDALAHCFGDDQTSIAELAQYLSGYHINSDRIDIHPHHPHPHPHPHDHDITTSSSDMFAHHYQHHHPSDHIDRLSLSSSMTDDGSGSNRHTEFQFLLNSVLAQANSTTSQSFPRTSIGLSSPSSSDSEHDHDSDEIWSLNRRALVEAIHRARGGSYRFRAVSGGGGGVTSSASAVGTRSPPSTSTSSSPHRAYAVGATAAATVLVGRPCVRKQVRMRKRGR